MSSTATNTPVPRADIPGVVARVVAQTPAYDIHTHLFAPAFDELLLAGIDEMLIYHYLVAEAFRYLDIPYEKFWSLPRTEQTTLIWEQLFIAHSPISEACRGVLTTLNRLGLDVRQRDLPNLRQWFARQQPDAYVDRVMQLAGVQSICMTNSPFDAVERQTWERGYQGDARFTCALRIDPLLLDWHSSGPQLADWGYDVRPDLGGKSLAEVRRFLADWSARMDAQYVMVSLPPGFQYPDESAFTRLIDDAVLPHCRENGLPFALMIGVFRAVNAELGLAGDGMAPTDLTPLRTLLAGNADVKFLCTVLARENQHELCVLARKFRNLHVFGCWWFMNVPSLIEEVTRLRMELLGTSFTAQHSDARVLDQIIYKWDHSRQLITRVLIDKYTDLAATGWGLTAGEIERDVAALLGGGFQQFLRR